MRLNHGLISICNHRPISFQHAFSKRASRMKHDTQGRNLSGAMQPSQTLSHALRLLLDIQSPSETSLPGMIRMHHRPICTFSIAHCRPISPNCIKLAWHCSKSMSSLTCFCCTGKSDTSHTWCPTTSTLSTRFLRSHEQCMNVCPRMGTMSHPATSSSPRSKSSMQGRRFDA